MWRRGVTTGVARVGGARNAEGGADMVGRREGDASLLALGRWIEAAVGVTPMPPEA